MSYQGAFDRSKTYYQGDQVSFNGQTWTALDTVGPPFLWPVITAGDMPDGSNGKWAAGAIVGTAVIQDVSGPFSKMFRRFQHGVSILGARR